MIGLLRLLVVTGTLSLAAGLPVVRSEEILPGKPFEYRPFFPDRWTAKQQSTALVPWEGRHVVLLTTTANLDRKVMRAFVDRLDAGWQHYAELVGQSPQPNRQFQGKVTIAAVPDASYTCGIGCGYLGSRGIEVGGFYQGDYPLVARQPDAFPHYYFYEMGRNYFVFGDRHNAFTTGYAVFMRYVCMDALKCKDNDYRIREAIELAESRFRETKLTFLQGFTNVAGITEKQARLTDLSPSDQPVMYASAMLKLRKDYGGDDWVKKFFHALADCPAVKADTEAGALAQSRGWLVSASYAAGQDLSDVFVDRWKLPLGPKTRAALRDVDWKANDANPVRVLATLPTEPVERP